MPRFRFLHAADLHLDTPFQGIGRTAPHVRERLRDASLEAWDGLVSLAIDRDVAFVLLAGDIYDGPERGVRAQLRFCAGLNALSGQGIRVFIVHGNHDPLEGWSAIRAWPDGVTVFGCTEVEAAEVSHSGQVLATVYGISYPRRDVTENLARRFRRGDGPGIHVALLHCNVGSDPEHALYSPCSAEDLCAAGMDYWALGHVHQARRIGEQNPLVLYPGCLQGRSLRAGDRGEKGAVIVDVDDEGRFETEFVALDRVRFVTMEVDIGGIPDLAALHRTLLDRSTQVRRSHAGRGVLLRTVLTGRGDVYRDLRRPSAIDDLVRVLRQDSELERPFIWWDAIVDRSAAAIDQDAIRARGDFSSELLRVAEALYVQPGRFGRLYEAAIEPLVRSGATAWLPASSEAERQDTWRESTRTALEMLEPD